ncbi:MAG: DUF1488 domain-containing protein [Gammaproteobacteria bacterium]|nr:DUF1488 domain-containing protein [Gammaproteobacteria bacterium]MBU1440725.1 DUF1488 domain-containing protein [Gammaproteobacteria bacterium]MBU2287231.1 DUF1488 domain-containing protein [Gammaproteobacteria bacterium]
MSDAPFFHEPSGTIRFWVQIDGEYVGGSIAKETLHYCYYPKASDDQPLETYTRHAQEIESAVRRRFAQGSTSPILIRDYDLHDASGKGVE